MKHPLFNPRSLLAFALLALCFLSGCASREFNRSWRQANSGGELSGIAGSWEGTWMSEATGHHGDLRCVVTPSEDNAGICDFRYWASWSKVVCGEFDVAYAVRAGDDGQYRVSGEKDLGKLGGGLYSHTGVATSEQFEATYRSKDDHGVFKMIRPAKPSGISCPPPAARPGNPATRFPRSPSRTTP